MRLTLGKRQLEVVLSALNAYQPEGVVLTKAKEAVITKLTAKPAAPLVTACTPAQIQDALHESSGGRVAKVAKADASYWVKAQNLIRKKQITVSEARLVGRWLVTQTWLTTPTFGMCLNKWEEWNAAAAQFEGGHNGSSGGSSRRAEGW